MLSSLRGLSLRLVPVLVAAALFLASPAVSGQCFGPDNLDLGSCCTPTVPNLPSFPPGTPPALGICWNACSVVGTQNLRTQWSPPSQVTCGQYISQLTVSDSGTGTPLLSGLLVLR